MDKRLLDILCCPTTRLPLRIMTDTERAALNQGILGDSVINGGGARVSQPVANGLITRDGRTVYRIDDDIPVMLADEAIATSQLTDFPNA
ncbi:MAG: Trm112 family protein [Dokdonella sp.]|uniref:Trm112 family protein n=1 Tax=Dokdonella sp. TaxID=2291710 RepID=UPI003263832B